MSYGTDFTADIFLNRQVYENKAQVQNAIEECEHGINEIEKTLYVLACANIKEITPNGEEPLRWIDMTMGETLAELATQNIKRYQLGLYLEFLEK